MMEAKGGNDMDQIQIGKFIAQVRKEKDLTQRQLADLLSISDKTVSKWECGKGLPEVSLMLPLCDTLQITVNDLLSGERVSDTNYQRKAEENMMNLIQENEENRKRMVLSIITGGITVIAVISIAVIVSYLSLPTVVRILLLMVAAGVAAAGIGAASMLDIRAGFFECPSCKGLFVPGMNEYIKAYHTFTRRRLTCPHCGRTGMCRHRVTR